MKSNTAPAASLPYLSGSALERLSITTKEILESIERAIVGQRHGKAWCAPKAVVMPDERYIMATLSVSEDPRIVVTKSLVHNPRNRERGLPTINSAITLLDGETGLPLAVMDGNWVTAKRTAGLSAVAAKRMARPDSTSIAFIGCGVEARSHLDAFADLFPLREIRAFGRGQANRDALCRIAETRGLRAIASETAKDAIGSVDIVVTSVTYSPDFKPFVDARWMKAGAFATMTDQTVPWYPESIPTFERILVDDLEQEKKMSKPMVAPELVKGDLTQLVCGDLPGRTSPKERTAFAFRGLAVGDLAVAGLVYQRAIATGT
ncbi:MAG TPA: ornithine cyclodeaminase family protein [Aestuariivirgaceae bacterium]|nr:ornithine cyclodeaminase family protein [Aestuariivirgaceae bacterium]